MLEIEDIQDRYKLRHWLLDLTDAKGEDEGRRIAVHIAHRAAMRTLPLIWRYTQTSQHERDRGLTAMPFLRAALISGIASERPSVEISEEAAVYSVYPAAATGSAEAESVRPFVYD